MSMAQIAGKTAFLPMDPYEVERFLYDLGLDGPGAEHHFEFVGGFYDDYRIDWGTDFRLANRLAQRVSDLGEFRDALKAWCCARHAKACWEKCSPGAFLTHPCTAADALRASYNMNTFTFLPGIGSDEILGDFALENELIAEYDNLPDDIYLALDKEKAGVKMREMDGGVFVNEGYLVLGEDFSGEPLPAEEPLAYFQVRFSDEQHDSGWCDVPLAESDERFIAKVFDCENLSGLPIENRSIIPYLNGMISGADERFRLDRLNEALSGMSGKDLLKYNALLEVVQPGDLSTALRLADNMDLYNVTLEYADPADYGLQHAVYQYGLDADCRLLNYVDLAGYGSEMLRAEGYKGTRYGAVHCNAMAQKFLAGPNTVYSDDYYYDQSTNFSTYVCWDPDTQKVWLELNDVTADDETYYEDLARYQYNCEDWGVHHCASREEYEQIVSEYAAQSYSETMAEEAQGFGGMEGMC